MNGHFLFSAVLLFCFKNAIVLDEPTDYTRPLGDERENEKLCLSLSLVYMLF